MPLNKAALRQRWWLSLLNKCSDFTFVALRNEPNTDSRVFWWTPYNCNKFSSRRLYICVQTTKSILHESSSICQALPLSPDLTHSKERWMHLNKEINVKNKFSDFIFAAIRYEPNTYSGYFEGHHITAITLVLDDFCFQTIKSILRSKGGGNTQRI